MPKNELYSNEDVDKCFYGLMFITFYLLQYHKNTFHNELFLSVYSILKIELYFSGL